MRTIHDAAAVPATCLSNPVPLSTSTNLPAMRIMAKRMPAVKC